MPSVVGSYFFAPATLNAAATADEPSVEAAAAQSADPPGATVAGATPRSMTQVRMELEHELARRADLGDLRLPSSECVAPDVHMTIVNTLIDVAATRTPRRRGPAGQRARRELERVVRRRFRR